MGDDRVTPAASPRRRLLAGIATTLVAAALLLPFVGLDWVPHDEGLFGMTARRVLQGQVPHQDFDDPYTGLLSLGHAVVLRTFGPSTLALRWALFAAAVPWIACVWWLASRATSLAVASVVTLTAVTWSLPAYFAPTPSWYNLFLATVAAAALLKGLERADDARPRAATALLVVAGVACGVSILVKITGLHAVAAGMLVLLFDEVESSRVRGLASGAPRSPLVVRVVVVAGCAAFAAAIAALTSWRPSAMGLIHFTLPACALAAVPAALEWRDGRGRTSDRLRSLLRRFAPFLAGVALPVAAWLAPQAAAGRLDAIWRGVVVLPAQRLDMASMALREWPTLVAVVPVALTLALGARLPRAGQLALGAGVGVLAALVAALGGELEWHAWTWNSVRPLVPVVAVAAALLLLRRDAPGTAPDRRRLLVFVLAAFAALVSLVQHPYAFGVYFCYAAPLVALALAAVAVQAGVPRVAGAALLAGFLAFGATWVAPCRVRAIGAQFVPREDLATLRPATVRGLRVPGSEAALYEAMTRAVAGSAPPGSVVYAAPDCPEVNLLTQTSSPVRSFYDFFEPDHAGDPVARARRLLDLIDAAGCRAAVINAQPEFSHPMVAELEAGLRARFPRAQVIGRFVVLTR